MKKMLIVIAAVLFLVIVVFAIGTRKKVGAPTHTFDYRCGDGSEFTLDYSADKERVHIIPASSIEKVPDVTVTSLPPGSRERYEGGGVSVFILGKALRVTVGEHPEVIECQMISN